MENEQKEMWERLTAVEQSTKSAHHRIDTLDKLTESVHIIATYWRWKPKLCVKMFLTLRQE